MISRNEIVLDLAIAIENCSYFQTCIDQEFNKEGFFVSTNTFLCEDFNNAVRAMILDIESNSNLVDTDDRLKIVGLLALVSLQNRLFPNTDRKLVNKIFDLCKKVS